MGALVLILVVSGCKGLLSGEDLRGFPKMAILTHEIDSNLNCLSNGFGFVSTRLKSSIVFTVTRSSKGRKEMENFLFEISC